MGLTDLLGDLTSEDELFEEVRANNVALIQAWATWCKLREDGDQPITDDGYTIVHDWLGGDWADSAFVPVGSDKWNQALAGFNYLAEKFEPYAAVSIRNGSGIKTSLELAHGFAEHGVLVQGAGRGPDSGHSVADMIGSAASELSDWQGDAAETFYADYLVPFWGLHGNRLDMIAALSAIVARQQQAVIAARQSVLTITKQTADALYAYGVGGDFDGTVEKLTVLAVLGAVGSAIPVIGWGTVAFAVMSGAATLAAAELSASVVGGSLSEILTSMDDQLAKVVEGVNYVVDELAKEIDEDIDKIKGNGPGGFSKDIVGIQPDPMSLGYEGFTYPDGVTED